MHVNFEELWVDDPERAREAIEHVEGLICHLALQQHGNSNAKAPAGSPLPAPPISVEQNEVP